MIACSFLPAATQMIYDMGLQHLLQGVTFECPTIALDEKNKVVRYVLEGNNYSSAEIDKIFSASKKGSQGSIAPSSGLANSAVQASEKITKPIPTPSMTNV